MHKKIISVFVGILIVAFTMITIFFSGAVGLIIYESFFKIPEEVTVPSVTSKRVTDAVVFLKKFNLKPKVKEEYRDYIPEGEIITQSPSAGENVRSGREIKITASLGPEMIAVPDIRGLPLKEGEHLLHQKRLALKSVKVNPEKSGREEIIEQNPKAGARVKRGTPVAITINKGAVVKYEVPIWEGKNFAEVITEAKNTPFSIGRIRWVYDDYISKDRIIRQAPSPGQFSSQYKPINIDVSAGIADADLFIKQETVRFMIPGESRTEVKATLKDKRGLNLIYQADHMPGDMVLLTVTTFGDGELRAIADGKLITKVNI